MDEKYQSLVQNNTWQLVDLPPNSSVIKTKWFFCQKYNSDGTLSCYKARLVAQGFIQHESLDYSKTFSPIIKITYLYIFLTFATLYSYHIHQMDVITVFFNDVLKEVVFITQPEGYIQLDAETKVCQLLKSLYRLKEAP